MSVLNPKRFYQSLIILFVIVLGSCSGFSLESIIPGSGPVTDAVVMVEVTFYVQVPLNTPEGEIIYLSTLDEVTGLGVNADAHPMDPALGEANLDQGLIYKTTLTVPRGTVLKYRYTRQNQYAIIEHTQIDEQVRYRIAHVDNPLEVRDVVTKWSDTEYVWSAPGRISGTLADIDTGNPVPGMLVTAGGVQTFTTSSGNYMLAGLPPGIHNMVVYAPDGSYQIVQQGAEVASQANTEANLNINKREYVDVTFLVSVPIGTPENSLRMAGNLFQLGNTFGNLPGGMNTTPSRMPKLAYAGGNQYGIILPLPVGAEIRYKYTLGDGFWNAEHNQYERFPIRRFIVPDSPVQRNDLVETWKSGTKDSITFDLWTPDHTPPDEEIYIQFNPYGWTTPLPMNELAPNHWVFILSSPFDIISDLTYRYCREGECGIADDTATRGEFSPGRSVVPSAEPQYIADTVENWAWLETDLPSAGEIQSGPHIQDESYLKGIELMPGSKTASFSQVSSIIPEISGLNANWVFLTPTWTFTHQSPPVFEPDPNHDPLWFDLTAMSGAANQYGLKLAYFPQPHFPESARTWWESAPRDFSWWNSWFDQYRNFALHYAQAAETQGIDMLVLGGDWITPALPGGKLGNGEPSGVPADSELRWVSILTDVKAQFSGTIAWAIPLPSQDNKPSYLDLVDLIFLNWTPDLQVDLSTNQEELLNQVNQSLDGDVRIFWRDWLKPADQLLILRIAYPSVSGWDSNCSMDTADSCYLLEDFTIPGQDFPGLSLGISEQEFAYSALLSAISDKNWVSGVISWGYYAPAVLHDKSISIHGKTAERLLESWFSGMEQ
jgi:hypothetical protein